MLKEVKALIKLIYDPIWGANKDAIVNTVTDADCSFIWDPSVLDEEPDDNSDKYGMQVQEEGDDVVQSLDMQLDEHQTDQLCMLLKCYAEMSC